MLVAVINESSGGFDLGVTLSVGGLLITGYVASGKRFFDEFASEVAENSPGSDDTREAWRAALASPGDIYMQESKALPEYIHFRDARFYCADRSARMPRWSA